MHKHPTLSLPLSLLPPPPPSLSLLPSEQLTVLALTFNCLQKRVQFGERAEVCYIVELQPEFAAAAVVFVIDHMEDKAQLYKQYHKSTFLPHGASEVFS